MNGKLTGIFLGIMVAVGSIPVAHGQLIETLDPRPVPFQPTTSRIGHYANPGAAVGALPGAIFFHWQLFHIGPDNAERLNTAILNEWAALSPGESKDLNVFASNTGGALIFKFVAEEGQPQIIPTDVFVIGKITIEAPDKIFMNPVSALDSAGLGSCAAANLCSDEIEIDDHQFVARHLNTVRGTLAGPALVSLTDLTAKTGAAGMVILRAEEGSQQYEVFNTQTNQVESHNKGASMQARKNTVWLLVSDGNRLYTVVHNRLASIEGSAVPGATLAAADVLGEYSNLEDSGVEIWRVQGPADYFLGGSAYRVAPIR